MMALGTEAPDFTLPNTADGETVSRAHFASKPLLVMFICNHCPYVKHVAAELARLGKEYQDKGVGIIAISSNDVDNYPDDHPDRMKLEAQQRGYTFPYLYDEDQSVAQAYSAACTPDFFLFDANHKLAYRGQLDDTRPTRISSGNYSNENAAHGADLRAALDAVLKGEQPSDDQKPSMGCNIKWKPGNAPR